MERVLDEAEAALAAESDQEAQEAGDQVEVPAEGPKDQGGPEEEGADEIAELKNSRPGHGVLPTARPPSAADASRIQENRRSPSCEGRACFLWTEYTGIV